MERYFQVSLHALIISSFIPLALTGRLDAPSIVIFSIGVTVSAYRAVKKRAPLLTPRAVFYVSYGYVVFFIFDSMHEFIPATIHLVLFLELAKLYQSSKNEKD